MEKQRNMDTESRHAQELNDLKEQHECELTKAKDQLTKMHENEKWQLNQSLENLRSEYMDYRQQSTVSKQEADDKLSQLVSEMNNSEEARNEIKQRLAQVKNTWPSWVENLGKELLIIAISFRREIWYRVLRATGWKNMKHWKR